MRTVSHSVLFRQFPLDELDALAPVVAHAYGVTDYDARMKIRRGWGFLERDVTEEDAQRIVAAVGDCAGGCFTLHNARMQDLAEPKVMTGLAIAPNGFTPQLQSPQDKARLVEWSQVSIVAAGGFSEEFVRREAGGDEKKMGKMMAGLGVFMVTGIPMGLFGGGKKKDAQPVKSNRLLTFGRIVTTAGEQFAFSSDHFDFSGLGDKKQMNTAANFRTLFAELSQLTPAKLNFGARFVLNKQSLTLANYTGLHDCETELLWMHNVAINR